MSKIGNWLMEMQEDAAWSSKEVFIRKHGISNEVIWTETRRQMAEDSDVDVEDYWGTFDMEMDDGS
jgi:hypothetical protein